MSNRRDRTSSSKAESRAAARAEVLRAHRAAERRRRLLKAAAAIVAVLVVVAVVVVVALNVHRKSGPASSAASESVISQVTGVPKAVVDRVGAGTVQTLPAKIDAPALTSGTKPRILYVGAEYCPYCAAERWAVVAALSRFGTFTGLGQTTSSAQDIYPSTATLSFHGASYRSDYLAFTGVELQSNQIQGNSYAPLDTLSPADQKILDTYDQKTYTGVQDGSIPFLDLGGGYVSAGASYSPQLLAGLTHAQIAASLSDPTSDVAKAVLGTANSLTARICRLTGEKPAAVCTSPGVTAAR